MTELEHKYGLTKPVERNSTDELIHALQRINAMFNLMLVPDYTVQDYHHDVQTVNYQNNAGVGRS